MINQNRPLWSLKRFASWNSRCNVTYCRRFNFQTMSSQAWTLPNNICSHPDIVLLGWISLKISLFTVCILFCIKKFTYILSLIHLFIVKRLHPCIVGCAQQIYLDSLTDWLTVTPRQLTRFKEQIGDGYCYTRGVLRLECFLLPEVSPNPAESAPGKTCDMIAQPCFGRLGSPARSLD